MLKFLTEMLGLKVILYQEQALVGEVHDYLIDHETGEFLGVLVNSPLEKKEKIIPTGEFKAIGQDSILVSDLNSLTDIEDFIKGSKALKTNAKIIGETAKTESGKVLGKVTESAINTQSFKIERIYVRPKIGLKIPVKDLIIPATKITEITKKYILVSDEYVTAKAKKSILTVPARL